MPWSVPALTELPAPTASGALGCAPHPEPSPWGSTIASATAYGLLAISGRLPPTFRRPRRRGAAFRVAAERLTPTSRRRRIVGPPLRHITFSDVAARLWLATAARADCLQQTARPSVAMGHRWVCRQLCGQLLPLFPCASLALRANPMSAFHAQDLRLLRTHRHPVPVGAAALTALLHSSCQGVLFRRRRTKEKRWQQCRGPHATYPDNA